MVLCCCKGKDDAVADKRSGIENTERGGLRRCEPPKPLPQRVVEVPVQVNVYSLLEQNKKLKKVGMGVYHCGIVIYGIEWGYGEAVESTTSSGLFCVYPGQAAGTLYRTIFIGVTTLSPQQVDTILHRLENEWRSEDYHILNHNCNHFAQRFCDLLSTVQKLRIPVWCNRAARVCDKIVPKKLATYVHRMIDEEPPKAPAPEWTRIGELPQSVIPRNWYLHPSISQEPRFVATPSSDNREGNSLTTPGEVLLKDIACANVSVIQNSEEDSRRSSGKVGHEKVHINNNNNEEYEDDAPSGDTMPAVASLHRDPSCHDSLNSKSFNSPEGPFPLILQQAQDACDIVFLAGGSGVTPLGGGTNNNNNNNNNNTLFSNSIHIKTKCDSQVEHRSFIQLESVASQPSGQLGIDTYSEEEHNEEIDKRLDNTINNEEESNNINNNSNSHDHNDVCYNTKEDQDFNESNSLHNNSIPNDSDMPKEIVTPAGVISCILPEPIPIKRSKSVTEQQQEKQLDINNKISPSYNGSLTLLPDETRNPRWGYSRGNITENLEEEEEEEIYSTKEDAVSTTTTTNNNNNNNNNNKNNNSIGSSPARHSFTISHDPAAKQNSLMRASSNSTLVRTTEKTVFHTYNETSSFAVTVSGKNKQARFKVSPSENLDETIVTSEEMYSDPECEKDEHKEKDQNEISEKENKIEKLKENKENKKSQDDLALRKVLLTPKTIYQQTLLKTELSNPLLHLYNISNHQRSSSWPL